MAITDIIDTPAKEKLGVKRRRVYSVDKHKLVPTHELHLKIPDFVIRQGRLEQTTAMLKDRCIPIVASVEETLSLHDMVGIKAKNIVAFVKDATLDGDTIHITIQPTGLYVSLITNSAVSIKWSLGDRKRRTLLKPVRYLIMERVLIN